MGTPAGRLLDKTTRPYKLNTSNSYPSSLKSSYQLNVGIATEMTSGSPAPGATRVILSVTRRPDASVISRSAGPSVTLGVDDGYVKSGSVTSASFSNAGSTVYVPSGTPAIANS